MTKSLATCQIGDTVTVMGFHTVNHAFQRKLMSLGLTPGAHLTLVRKAPLGDPLHINVRGISLTLRLNEAESILVEKH